MAVESGKVVGATQLVLAWQPNAPHRAEIQKLLVHSTQRRRGIASQLLQYAEGVARDYGRWLLILDTEVGSSAQYLYEKMSYKQIGIVPQHALNIAGIYADTVIFHKILT